jgi:hypothetical protein
MEYLVCSRNSSHHILAGGAMPRTILTFAIIALLAGGAAAQNVTLPVPTDLKAETAPTLLPMPVVKLNWDAPAGQWAFKLYRSSGDSLNFAQLAVTGDHVFFDRVITGSNTYYYRVTSFTIGADSQIAESKPSYTAWITLGSPLLTWGTIAGTVKDDTTGRPIAGVMIQFYRMDPGTVARSAPPFAVTDSLGQYKAMLVTGTYAVHAEPAPYMPPGPPPYMAEWYDNVYELSKATPVKVEAEKVFTADFGLSRKPIPIRPKGVISGTVIDDSTMKPIRGAMIRFFSRPPIIQSYPPLTVTTDSLGHYSALLDTSTYLVLAEGPPMGIWFPSYIAEWYDNATDIGKATPIHVSDGSQFTADFGLSRPAQPKITTVKGTVTDTLGNPLRGAVVAVMRPVQENATDISSSVTREMPNDAVTIEGVGFCPGVFWKGVTDSAGHYSVRVLAGRTYIALASKWGYLPEYYKEKVNPLQADLIKVDDDVSGIDFTLALNPVLHNSISGVVRDSAGTGVPSCIILFPIKPVWPIMAAVRFGHTDSNGVYTIGGVRSGKYFVLAVPFHKYAPAFYKEGGYGVRYWQKADTVLISGDVTGINIGVVPVMHRGVICVIGRVLGPDSSPLDGVRVFAVGTAGEMLGFGLTDNTGSYSISGLGAVAMTLAFDREGYQAGHQSVNPTGNGYFIDIGDLKLAPAVTQVVNPHPFIPAVFQLYQNYPNPFNPSTTITFDMPIAGTARLVIYNIIGQEILTLYNKPVAAGQVAVTWNGKDRLNRPVASGLYLVRFSAFDVVGVERFTQMRKMLLVK